jgi:H+/Cl- antiporter ClcA
MPFPTDEAATQPNSLEGFLRVARVWLRGDWRAACDIDPELWRNLQQELLAGRQWFDRAVVLAYATATGVIELALTLLAFTVAQLWLTHRDVLGARGSGIPQVMRALDEGLPPSQSPWQVSLRVSLHKTVLVLRRPWRSGRASGTMWRSSWA